MFDWFIWHSLVVVALSSASFGIYTCLFLKARERTTSGKIYKNIKIILKIVKKNQVD